MRICLLFFCFFFFNYSLTFCSPSMFFFSFCYVLIKDDNDDATNDDSLFQHTFFLPLVLCFIFNAIITYFVSVFKYFITSFLHCDYSITFYEIILWEIWFHLIILKYFYLNRQQKHSEPQHFPMKTDFCNFLRNQNKSKNIL